MNALSNEFVGFPNQMCEYLWRSGVANHTCEDGCRGLWGRAFY